MAVFAKLENGVSCVEINSGFASIDRGEQPRTEPKPSPVGRYFAARLERGSRGFETVDGAVVEASYDFARQQSNLEPGTKFSVWKCIAVLELPMPAMKTVEGSLDEAK